MATTQQCPTASGVDGISTATYNCDSGFFLTSNDVTPLFSNARSFCQCRDLCAETKACVYLLWSDTDGCTLRTLPDPKRYSSWFKGSAPGQIVDGNLSGCDLATPAAPVVVRSMKECVALCSSDAACAFVSFESKTGNCYPKNHNGASDGDIMAFRSGGLPGVVPQLPQASSSSAFAMPGQPSETLTSPIIPATSAPAADPIASASPDPATTSAAPTLRPAATSQPATISGSVVAAGSALNSTTASSSSTGTATAAIAAAVVVAIIFFSITALVFFLDHRRRKADGESSAKMLPWLSTASSSTDSSSSTPQPMAGVEYHHSEQVQIVDRGPSKPMTPVV